MRIAKWSRECVYKDAPKQFRHRHVRRVFVSGVRVFEIVVIYDFVLAVWKVQIRNNLFDLISEHKKEGLEEAISLGDRLLEQKQEASR